MCADIGRTDLIRIAYVDSSEYAKLTSVTNRLPTPNKLKYSGKHHYSVYFTYASDANSNAISNEKKYELEWFFPLFFFYFPNSSGTSNERNTLAVSAGSRQLSKSFIFCGRTIIMSRFGSRCVEPMSEAMANLLTFIECRKEVRSLLWLHDFCGVVYFRLFQIEFTTKIAPFSIQIATNQTT